MLSAGILINVSVNLFYVDHVLQKKNTVPSARMEQHVMSDVNVQMANLEMDVVRIFLLSQLKVSTEYI